MSEKKKPEPLKLSEDEKEIVALGAAFNEIKTMRGWQLFWEILERHRQQIGLAALDDETMPKEYWRGRRDEVTELMTSIEESITRASEVVESTREAVSLGVRLGSGSASIGD